MKIELIGINNGWIIKHDFTTYINDDEIYFKTIKQAVAYSKKLLDKYSKKNE